MGDWLVGESENPAIRGLGCGSLALSDPRTL